MIPRIREWRRTTIRVEVKSNCQNLSDSRTTSIHMSTSNNIMNLFCSSWNFTYLMRTATRNENSIAEKLNDRIRFDIVIVFENIEIFSFEIRSLIVNKVRTIELPKFLKKGTNLFERFILFLFLFRKRTLLKKFRIFGTSSELKRCQSAPGSSPLFNRSIWFSSSLALRISSSTSVKTKRKPRFSIWRKTNVSGRSHLVFLRFCRHRFLLDRRFQRKLKRSRRQKRRYVNSSFRLFSRHNFSIDLRNEKNHRKCSINQCYQLFRLL